MSRSLVTFLTFLVLLLGGFAVFVWWVGPAMVSLALDEERRSTPYYLVHLVDAEVPADYFQAFGQLLREDQGQLLWRGSLTALHAGRSRDEVAEVAIIEFAEGAGVVQMMTSSGYRDLGVVAKPVLLGSVAAPGPIARDEVLVLWLLEAAVDNDAPALESLSASAAEFEGQLIWSTAVDGLAGERSWNFLLLLAFPDSTSVQLWLEDPETGTDRALGRRLYLEEAILELSSG